MFVPLERIAAGAKLAGAAFRVHRFSAKSVGEIDFIQFEIFRLAHTLILSK